MQCRGASQVGGSCLCLISKELEGDWVWHFEGKQLEVKSCPVELEIDPKILRINTPSSLPTSQELQGSAETFSQVAPWPWVACWSSFQGGETPCPSVG